MTSDPDFAFTIDALYLYPVKACGPQAVAALSIGPDGAPEGDRAWAIVNDRREVTWQGDHPRLALVHPVWTPDDLVLHATGLPPLAVPTRGLSPVEVTIWNDTLKQAEPFPCGDAGDIAAAWLRQVTGAALRLVRLGPAALARQGLQALHVVTRASADDVDHHLAARGEPAADPRRYRPNVLLRGAPPAFDEEHVRRFSGPPGDLDVTGPCVRCTVPNVDPATAAVSPHTLDALTRLSSRRRPNLPVAFGIYARATPGALLSVGDTLAAEYDF